MTEAVRLELNCPPDPEELCALREAVGWERAAEDYPAAFDAYASFVTARTQEGRLVGWCASVADGVRHGFLLDAIVQPAWQRQGLGRELVERCVADLAERGLTILHVDFREEHAAFYERCGFRPSVAGIRELGP